MSKLLENGPMTSEEADDLRRQLGQKERLVESLERDLRDAQQETKDERDRSANAKKALAAVRHQLQPLFTSLRLLFGELDTVDIPDSFVGGKPATGAPQNNSVWESQKRRFPGRPADIIDALLERPGMTTQALATTLRADVRTISRNIFVLNKAGLIEKNGSQFFLKEL